MLGKGNAKMQLAQYSVRPFTDKDIEKVCEWVNANPTSAFYFSSRFGSPLKVDEFRQYWETNQSEVHQFFAFTQADGKVVGHFEIKNISKLHQNGTAAHVIIAPSERGKKLGHKMMLELQRISFSDLKLHRLGLSVHSTNSSATSCYLRAGFKIEGLIREVLSHKGLRQDLYQMSMLSSEYGQRLQKSQPHSLA